jgi:hypothetical protein
MENARPDENSVFSKTAVLNTDTVQGMNLVRIQVDENNGNSLKVNTTATISFTMVPVDPRDENYRTCATFTGSDGLVYPWVATEDGEVLIST